MGNDSLTNITIKGTLWSFTERFFAQGVHFLVMVVMARLLSPKEFGLIGMLAIFIAVAQSLIDSGFSQALIRKQNRSDVDKNTVFYFNIVVSSFLYILLYLLSPWVASFYDEAHLCKIMRVTCLVIVINSFGVVQRANFVTAVDFKSQTKASLIAAIVSGFIGVYLAYYDYGVWALVYQQLSSSVMNVIALWFYSSWYPKMVYSWASFRALFGFGSKLMISGLLDTLYRNIYQLVIGKIFSADNLGYYTNAQRFSDFPSSNLTSVLQRVTYPVMCSIQNDDERLVRAYRKFLRLSAFIIFPLMCGLAALSTPMVNIVLGKQWQYTAVLMIPLCFQMMWYPIHSINLNLLQVKGRSDLFLRLEIIKKIIGVSVLFCSLPFGLLAMCCTGVLTSIICLAINTYYTGKIINVGFIMQMKDISISLFVSLTMFGLVFYCISIIDNDLIKLISGFSMGIIYFAFISVLFKMKEIIYIKEILTR